MRAVRPRRHRPVAPGELHAGALALLLASLSGLCCAAPAPIAHATANAPADAPANAKAHAQAARTGPLPAPTPAPTAPPVPAPADAIGGGTSPLRPPRPLPARPWADEILYSVLVDRFADGDLANDAQVDRAGKGAFHGGDLKGLLAHLDEIASLGVTALWLNPLLENIAGPVTGAGFPDWPYHGYWTDDFTRLDPRFGTEDELLALVRACHRRKIRVLLDVVYNHAGYGSHYLTDPKTAGFLRSNETGSCGADDLTTCVSGLPDFRTELPAVADFLITAQLAWARRSGADGFRLDAVRNVGHPFWREQRRRSRALLGPSFFLLGEVFAGNAQSLLDDYFAADEFDAGFDFSFQPKVLAFLQERASTASFDRYLAARMKVRPGYLLAQFLSSNDVPGALYLLHGDLARFRLAATLEFTTAGIPTIDYGEEVARLGGDWPANRSDMPWGDRLIEPGAGRPRDEALRADYQKLIAIRRAHPALSRGSHRGLVTLPDLYVFERRLGDDVVLVAIDRGGAASVDIPLPAEWRGRPAIDLLDGSRIPIRHGLLYLALGPHSARVVSLPGRIAAIPISKRSTISPQE